MSEAAERKPRKMRISRHGWPRSGREREVRMSAESKVFSRPFAAVVSDLPNFTYKGFHVKLYLQDVFVVVIDLENGLSTFNDFDFGGSPLFSSKSHFHHPPLLFS